MKTPREVGAGRELLAELAPWLVIVALGDWLLLRTISRTAIFVPKTPLLAELFTWLGRTGQLAANATTLLALLCLGWIVWVEGQRRRGLPLAVTLAGLLAASTLFVFVPSGRWLVAVQLLLVTATGLLLLRLWQRDGSGFAWAVLPAGTALLLAALHQLTPTLAGAVGARAPLTTGVLFQSGEALVVLSPLALWWVYRRPARWQVQMGAALPGLLFGVVYLASPSMTATIVVWSTGLTLYLPWWVYAFSLWVGGSLLWHTLSAPAASDRRKVAYGLLLLAAGGYAPQLSVHQFLGVIGLWLLLADNSAESAHPKIASNAVFAAVSQPMPPSRATPPA